MCCISSLRTHPLVSVVYSQYLSYHVLLFWIIIIFGFFSLPLSELSHPGALLPVTFTQPPIDGDEIPSSTVADPMEIESESTTRKGKRKAED